MKIVAAIPARGGSKGIPRKNVRLIAGKPLIAHTIGQALQARAIGRIFVSTDDGEIANISGEYGAEVVKRPAELASDNATSESALLHILDYLNHHEGFEPDLVVFLQCTSPVRRSDDIDRAVDHLLKSKADSLVSGTAWHGFLWHEERGDAKPVNYDYLNRRRRQDLPEVFRENGSIFIFKPWVLRKFQNRLGGKIVLYPMDFWSAYEIDVEEDLALCEWILKSRQADAR
jgi:CMP-N,N'-diacetyllegionaminic acid synthase